MTSDQCSVNQICIWLNIMHLRVGNTLAAGKTNQWSQSSIRLGLYYEWLRSDGDFLTGKVITLLTLPVSQGVSRPENAESIWGLRLSTKQGIIDQCGLISLNKVLAKTFAFSKRLIKVTFSK